jgi:hypothetical protein
VLLSGREEHVMATTTAPNPVLPRTKLRTIARGGVSRKRRNAAAALEITLDPQLAQRRALRFWPRIPRENRAAVTEPLQEVVSLLRDPAITLPDDAVEQALRLVTWPTSPVYGPYPNQAGFAAYLLIDHLRTSAGHVAT